MNTNFFSLKQAAFSLLLSLSSVVPCAGKAQDSSQRVPVCVPTIKFTNDFSAIHETFAVVGIENGLSIYRNSSGIYFTINPQTGKMVYLEPGKKTMVRTVFMMQQRSRPVTIMFNPDWIKDRKNEVQVSLIGVDYNGNVIQENDKHQRFYLDPKTGEIVYVQ